MTMKIEPAGAMKQHESSSKAPTRRVTSSISLSDNSCSSFGPNADKNGNHNNHNHGGKYVSHVPHHHHNQQQQQYYQYMMPPPMAVPQQPQAGQVLSIVKSPSQAYASLVEKGVGMSNQSLIKIFHQSFYAGIYIGFGGMLSMVVAGGLAAASEDNPTIQVFVFAALFPVNLLIILLTGGVLFTGTSAVVAAAVFEGRLSWKQIPRTFSISWIGNLMGALVFALLIEYCEMNIGDTAKLAIKVAEKKVAKPFLITFIKGIGCNWLVCMAVFLSSQAQDMTGKMVGIWFPISCFVAIGFEHIPANFFMIPLGMLAGADVSVTELIVKNFIPVTLGNAFAGSICVAGGYSFAFGSLGGNKSLRKKAKDDDDESADDDQEDDEAHQQRVRGRGQRDLEEGSYPEATSDSKESSESRESPKQSTFEDEAAANGQQKPLVSYGFIERLSSERVMEM